MTKQRYATLEGVHSKNGGDRPLSPRDQMYAHMSELNFGQVVLYSRKSTNGENAGKSIEDQNQCNLETVKYHKLPADETSIRAEEPGYGGDLWWAGGGASGIKEEEETNGKQRIRPVLTRIVEEIVGGKIKAIVCYDQDRMWRDVGIADAMIDLFVKYGVLLIDRYNPVDVRTPEGRQTVRQSAISAQAYRERIAADVARGLRMSREQGKLVTTANKLGFRSGGWKSRAVVVVPEELDLVRRIFRLYVYGENGGGPLSTARIANLLMAEKYPWPRDLLSHRDKRSGFTDHVIYRKQIGSVLTDCRYQGRQPHAGEEWNCPLFLVEGKPVVDVALYERAQAKRVANASVGNASKQERALVGLFRCAICGQSMQRTTSRYDRADGSEVRFSYWKNVKHNPSSWCTHSLPSMREEVMDAYVDQVFAPLLLADIRDKATGQSAAELASRCAELTRELREKTDAWEQEARRLRSDGVKPRTIALYEQDHDGEITRLEAALSDAQRLVS